MQDGGEAGLAIVQPSSRTTQRSRSASPEQSLDSIGRNLCRVGESLPYDRRAPMGKVDADPCEFFPCGTVHGSDDPSTRGPISCHFRNSGPDASTRMGTLPSSVSYAPQIFSSPVATVGRKLALSDSRKGTSAGVAGRTRKGHKRQRTWFSLKQQMITPKAGAMQNEYGLAESSISPETISARLSPPSASHVHTRRVHNYPADVQASRLRTGTPDSFPAVA